MARPGTADAAAAVIHAAGRPAGGQRCARPQPRPRRAHNAGAPPCAWRRRGESRRQRSTPAVATSHRPHAMISADTPRPPPPPPPPRRAAGRRPPARRGRRQRRRRHRRELSPASRTVPRVANCHPRRELSPRGARPSRQPLQRGAGQRGLRSLVHPKVPPPPAAGARRVSPSRHHVGMIPDVSPARRPPSACLAR